MNECSTCGADSSAPPPPGRIVRRRRLELGFTQDQLLGMTGLDRTIQWLSHLETKRSGAPPWHELDALCQALSIDAREALAGRMVPL